MFFFFFFFFFFSIGWINWLFVLKMLAKYICLAMLNVFIAELNLFFLNIDLCFIMFINKI